MKRISLTKLERLLVIIKFVFTASVSFSIGVDAQVEYRIYKCTIQILTLAMAHENGSHKASKLGPTLTLGVNRPLGLVSN